jgi:two-component system OmpR family sensor kinase
MRFPLPAFGRAISAIVPRSLRSQLLFRSLLILAALLVFIGILQFVFMKQFLYQNKAAAMQRQMMSIPGDFMTRFKDYPKRSKDRTEPFLFFPSSSVAYISPDGTMNVLFQDPDSGSVPNLPMKPQEDEGAPPYKAGKPHYDIVVDDKGIEQLVVRQPIHSFDHRDLEGGYLQISTRTAPLKSDLYRQLILFVSLSVFALIVGFFAFLPVLRRTLVPLSRMVDTVGQIDSGNLNERLPGKQGQTEIDRLSHSFNHMLERLEYSFRTEQEAKEQMRRFVADASHELRTPLTSIHGFLEVLLRGAASQPGQLERALQSMYGESARMNKLVQDLLLLAKLDRAPAAHLSLEDLSDIVRDMEPQLSMLADPREVVFDLNFPAPAFVNEDKMKQIVLNLFQNAVQHTDPSQGRITVSVLSGQDGIELIVADNGHGIAPEHLPYLFDRFYRIDSSRTRKSGGSGLGLAITQSLVQLHGGTIEATSRPGVGSEFRVRLPV